MSGYNFEKSTTLITAIHGGAIERGTTEIAQLISEQGDHSFYSFKGIRNNKNNELHVTSRHFNEPKLAQMVSDHHNIVSLHGCMGDVPEVYIGGRDFELASEIKSQLEKIAEKAPMDNQIKINFGGRIVDGTDEKKGLKKYDHTGENLEPLTKQSKKQKQISQQLEPDVIDANLFKDVEEQKEEKKKAVLQLEHAQIVED